MSDQIITITNKTTNDPRQTRTGFSPNTNLMDPFLTQAAKLPSTFPIQMCNLYLRLQTRDLIQPSYGQLLAPQALASAIPHCSSMNSSQKASPHPASAARHSTVPQSNPMPAAPPALAAPPAKLVSTVSAPEPIITITCSASAAPT